MGYYSRLRRLACRYSAGTFARALKAYFLTGAPTNGATSFVDQVASGARVYEDRGDGAGRLFRVEGARTQILANPRNMSSGWAAGSSYTPTYDASNAIPDRYGVDGTSVADRMAVLAGGFGHYQGSFVTAGASTKYSAHAWLKRPNGQANATAQFGIQYGALQGQGFTIVTVGQTWQLVVCVGADTQGSAYYVPSDGRAAGACSALAIDMLYDFNQLELGEFPSSFIDAAGARPADTLTFLSGDVDPALFTRFAGFHQLSPEFANTDVASTSAAKWLLSLGGSSDGIRIRHDGTGVCVEALAGGVVKARSQYLTFSRHALLGEVAWDPAAGLVWVNGTPGPSGTPWSWSSAGVRIGGIHSAANEAFCRFGDLRVA